MDLVAIVVGLAVAQSFMELSFGEPRWRPSPLQAKMVAAGRLGGESRRGWDGCGDGAHRADAPASAQLSDSAELDLLERVQCCIVNEGVFALGEGVGSADDI